ncbi:hypothetical protein SKAU_G00401940 [Synaphobranchus kaupii]|uniref:Nuclear transcription factor Y subunit gamma n=1 Tax=Synaphobranchus kaupii TaxID=118154 RepID=A0A9Q1E975_SYNKA|nr:hypothetical protein SKAU_G00401940 [Synaphobranchus kaupii]
MALSQQFVFSEVAFEGLALPMPPPPPPNTTRANSGVEFLSYGQSFPHRQEDRSGLVHKWAGPAPVTPAWLGGERRTIRNQPALRRGKGMSADSSFGAAGSDAQQNLQTFWPRVMEEIRNLTMKDFRVQELPLARIKKIMKLDEDVKMISAEAPVLFAKAAQIFITELTLRAWIHTEDNKRRTLQVTRRPHYNSHQPQLRAARSPVENDIAMAITKFDQFDFLIDIVPRDELKPPKRQEEVRQSVAPAEPVQYYFTLAQQPGVQVQGQQQGQQATASTTTLQPGQIIITQPQQGQVLQGATMQQLQQVQVAQSQATPITSAPVTMQVGEGQQVQIVQAAAQGQAQTAQPAGQTMQVMQQIITNTGEIQQIPVQLNTGQLQYIRLAQPVSGTQVVQGQIQTLATNAQQITQTEVQQGQQQFNQFTDGQQLYQIQQVTMPAGQELTQPMFIQSTSQTADGQSFISPSGPEIRNPASSSEPPSPCPSPIFTAGEWPHRLRSGEYCERMYVV